MTYNGFVNKQQTIYNRQKWDAFFSADEESIQ